MSGKRPAHCRCMIWKKSSGTVEHDEGIATASGWVTQKFGGFPKSGDTLAVGACELRVEEMDGPRVARLKITKSVDAEDSANRISR